MLHLAGAAVHYLRSPTRQQRQHTHILHVAVTAQNHSKGRQDSPLAWHVVAAGVHIIPSLSYATAHLAVGHRGQVYRKPMLQRIRFLPCRCHPILSLKQCGKL